MSILQKKLLERLARLWSSYPELRLGQLLRALAWDRDLFFLRDEALLILVEKQIDHAEVSGTPCFDEPTPGGLGPLFDSLEL